MGSCRFRFAADTVFLSENKIIVNLRHIYWGEVVSACVFLIFLAFAPTNRSLRSLCAFLAACPELGPYLGEECASLLVSWGSVAFNLPFPHLPHIRRSSLKLFHVARLNVAYVQEAVLK